jgi:hypothetical protein
MKVHGAHKKKEVPDGIVFPASPNAQASMGPRRALGRSRTHGFHHRSQREKIVS